MEDVELVRTLTDHDNEIKSLKRRMNNVEEVTKEIRGMALSIERMAIEAKNTGDKVDSMAAKVEALEKKPGEKAEKLKDSLITDMLKVIVGAALGAVLALILK